MNRKGWTSPPQQGQSSWRNLGSVCVCLLVWLPLKASDIQGAKKKSNRGGGRWVKCSNGLAELLPGTLKLRGSGSDGFRVQAGRSPSAPRPISILSYLSSGRMILKMPFCLPLLGTINGRGCGSSQGRGRAYKHPITSIVPCIPYVSTF